MLTLLTFPAGFDQFSLSPFCVKAACLLQMSGQPWARRDVTSPDELQQMPHQKLPVVQAEGKLISDSEAIRAWLERTGTDFDRDLDDLQKAHSRALIRMADEHLYYHLLMDRWGNEVAWPVVRDALFHMVPAEMREAVAGEVREAVLKRLDSQGIARLSEQQRGDALELDLRALASILTQTPFLFGARPSAADLSVAPMLAAMQSLPVRTNLAARLANDSVLAEYLTRMTQTVPLP